MSKERFDHMMALWIKGKEFATETGMDGNVVVYPKNSKEKIYAVIDPEKMEVHYYQDFPEDVRCALIPVDELDDLRHFVELLTEDD